MAFVILNEFRVGQLDLRVGLIGWRTMRVGLFWVDDLKCMTWSAYFILSWQAGPSGLTRFDTPTLVQYQYSNPLVLKTLEESDNDEKG